MYTLRQFRANTKQAFDDADQGREVVITRGKQKYQLISLVDDVLAGHSFESVPEQAPRLKSEKVPAPVPDFPRAEDSCEHGRGFKLCLVKGCKNYQFRRK